MNILVPVGSILKFHKDQSLYIVRRSGADGMFINNVKEPDRPPFKAWVEALDFVCGPILDVEPPFGIGEPPLAVLFSMRKNAETSDE